jgi:hypothetical protein
LGSDGITTLQNLSLVYILGWNFIPYSGKNQIFLQIRPKIRDSQDPTLRKYESHVISAVFCNLIIQYGNLKRMCFVVKVYIKKYLNGKNSPVSANAFVTNSCYNKKQTNLFPNLLQTFLEHFFVITKTNEPFSYLLQMSRLRCHSFHT